MRLQDLIRQPLTFHIILLGITLIREKMTRTVTLWCRLTARLIINYCNNCLWTEGITEVNCNVAHLPLGGRLAPESSWQPSVGIWFGAASHHSSSLPYYFPPFLLRLQCSWAQCTSDSRTFLNLIYGFHKVPHCKQPTSKRSFENHGYSAEEKSRANL